MHQDSPSVESFYHKHDDQWVVMWLFHPYSVFLRENHVHGFSFSMLWWRYRVNTVDLSLLWLLEGLEDFLTIGPSLIILIPPIAFFGWFCYFSLSLGLSFDFSRCSYLYHPNVSFFMNYCNSPFWIVLLSVLSSLYIRLCNVCDLGGNDNTFYYKH